MSLYVGQYNIERAELGFSVQALWPVCLSGWVCLRVYNHEDREVTELAQRRSRARERPTEGDHLGNINY